MIEVFTISVFVATIIIITRPVRNVGMGVNVIVATVPANSEVTPLRWMSLNMNIERL